MNNSRPAVSREVKKVMRTALIGVKPADLIMLKGYLRVLLRLEADLEWVSATHPEIDLYVINDEFRGSTSILKILKNQPQNKVLYVRRGEDDEGLMLGNLIILPLHSLKELNSWLYSNLPFLAGDTSAEQEQDEEVESTPKTNNTDSSNVSDSVVKSSSAASNSTTTVGTAATPIAGNGLLDVIEKIQARPEGLYELTCDQGKIALINLQRQRVWLVGEGSVTPDKSWQLQSTTQAMAPDINKSTDLFQWLWQQAWHAPEHLLPMISDERTYQLRFWPKPRMTNNRKELIHLLTVLESKPVLVRDLALQAETSVNSAKKVVAGLLLAGGLHPEAYRLLKQNGISGATTATTDSHTKTTEQTQEDKPAIKKKSSLLDEILARRSTGASADPATSERQSATSSNGGTNSVKEEKLGFLAKLRRKLGL